LTISGGHLLIISS